MIPFSTRLTMDDLEKAAFHYGGRIERTSTGWRLKTTIAGTPVTLVAA